MKLRIEIENENGLKETNLLPWMQNVYLFIDFGVKIVDPKTISLRCISFCLYRSKFSPFFVMIYFTLILPEQNNVN